MIGNLLRNEAYIGTVYYNRHEAIEGDARRGARTRKTRSRERPREEWIAISVPSIVERDVFEAAQRVSRDNSQWNPRGAEPGAWLLRGLVRCGHCNVGCYSHKIHARNGVFNRYYYCHNHDPIRAGGHDRRCPERHIRANELDAYVFEQVRQALTEPAQLIAGERAVIAGAPQNDDELVARQLDGLQRKIEQTERERRRLLDAYQAELIELDDLTCRTKTLTIRRDELTHEREALRERHAELSRQNRLSQGLASFAARIASSLDELDFDARQQLLRMLVEHVTVTGCRVDIHLKIPLADDPREDRAPTTPTPGPRPSSDLGVRPDDHDRLVRPARPPPRRHHRAPRPRPLVPLQDQPIDR